MSCDWGRRSAIVAAATLAAGAMQAQGADIAGAGGRNAGGDDGLPTSDFMRALVSRGPHPTLGAHADTYGRLIGSWAGQYEDRAASGPSDTGRLEIHFAWVLDGRAVQDLWIAPPLTTRRAAGQSGGQPAGNPAVHPARQPAGKRDTYGTTLRVFDPAAEVWRVLWSNPVTGARNDLIGRRVGDDIVQTGWYRDVALKWVFTGITRDRFVWQGLHLEPDGVTWRLTNEFNLKRTR